MKKNRRTAVLGIEIEKTRADGYKNILENTGGNTGNLLFTDAIYTQVNNPGFVSYEFDPEYINANFTSGVIAAANWISDFNDWSDFTKHLKLLEIPLCCVGLGAQIRESEISKIQKGTRDFLDFIGTKCKKVGLRGINTLAIYNKLGYNNCSIIGCPSLFRKLQRIRYIKIPRKKDYNISISYTKNGVAESEISKEQLILVQFALKYASNIILQSEYEEIMLKYNNGIEYVNELKKYYGFNNLDLDSLINKSLIFNDARSWIQFNRENVDLTISSRIHGCIASLLAEKPALLITHDIRTKELGEAIGLPTISIHEITEYSKDELVDRCLSHDWDNFLYLQMKNLKQLINVYKSCGIQTILA